MTQGNKIEHQLIPDKEVDPLAPGETEIGGSQHVNGGLSRFKDRNVHFIIMELGDGQYGFEIDSVQEVVFTPEMSEMPNTPDFVVGIASVREEMMIFLDLNKKFNLKQTNDNSEEETYSIVVESDHYIVGIISEKMPSTAIVDGNTIEGLDGNYAENALDASFVNGLVNVDGNVVFVVDMPALIESDSVSQIAETLYDDEQDD